MNRNPIAKACAPLRASAMLVALISTCFWASMESTRATEPEIDANGNTTGAPFEAASINLPPFRTNQNVTLAVESPDEAARPTIWPKNSQPDLLAHQRAFSVKLGLDVWSHRNGTRSPLTFNRSFHSPSARIGTSSSGPSSHCFPERSFLLANVPKNSPSSRRIVRRTA